jgi:hypothetical protein
MIAIKCRVGFQDDDISPVRRPCPSLRPRDLNKRCITRKWVAAARQASRWIRKDDRYLTFNRWKYTRSMPAFNLMNHRLELGCI